MNLILALCKSLTSLIDWDLRVLDLTSDLNIPTFVAVSRCGYCDSEDILLGFGFHFDAKIAVSRALTEINQILGVVLPT